MPRSDLPSAPPLRAVLGAGGLGTIGALTGLRLLDGLDGQAFGLLSPDIKASLHISNAVLGLIGSLGSAVFVLSAVPLGQLADRKKRTIIAAGCAGIAGLAAAATGFVATAFQLALARIASGAGKSAVLPVHGSLLADTYPAQGRNRVFAIHGLADPVAAVVGPIVIGLTALGATGEWRRAFVVLAVPLLALAAFTATRNEPRRDDAAIAFSTAAASARLRAIRSFAALLTGIGVVGFSLVAVPIFFSVLLDEQYHLGVLGRGLATSATEIGAIGGAVVGGVLGDRLLATDPRRLITFIAAGTAGYGVLFSVSVAMPGLAPMIIGVGAAKAVLYAGTVPVYALVTAVVPARLRALGLALLGLSVFLGGGFLGGLLTGLVSDAHGPRFALAATTAPVCLIAALVVLPARRHIVDDLADAATEAGDGDRNGGTGSGPPAEDAASRGRSCGPQPPQALVVTDLHVSYGSTPVLYGVDLTVDRGEILALLGTNGAGKSTILRAVSGLIGARRGNVWLSGRQATWASATDRVDLGLAHLPGGRAVFASMTVLENLLVGCHRFAWNRAEVVHRIDAAVERFPVLGERFDQPAGLLSGGEQQQLAVAKALLLQPTVLLVDELSLGLAPVVVGQLLGVMNDLRAEGVAIVLVEQSIDVALSLADRAMFLERGRVRFAGPAADLAGRDDLLRAVFLGSEGG